MLKRQREGSVICTSCGVLVGVNDGQCYNCGRRNPGLWGFAPALRALGTDLGFVPFVTAISAILFGLTLVFSRGQIGGGSVFSLFSPSIQALLVFGASGSVPVFQFGRWWTILSAGWLHGGVIHILFNMMALRFLAPGTTELFGPGRMMIIYFVSAASGFGLSSFAGAFLPALPFLSGGRFTVGASASLCGLIGAILAYGHRSGSGMARSYATTYIVMLVIYGFLFPGIDNYAHAGGFAGGYAAAKALDPLRPERIDHIVIGLALLGASLLSILWSFVDAVV